VHNMGGRALYTKRGIWVSVMYFGFEMGNGSGFNDAIGTWRVHSWRPGGSSGVGSRVGSKPPRNSPSTEHLWRCSTGSSLRYDLNYCRLFGPRCCCCSGAGTADVCMQEQNGKAEKRSHAILQHGA
jgi:hypothetical protein